MKLSRNGLIIIVFLLIGGLLVTYCLRRTMKPKYYTGEEGACMGRLKAIGMSFHIYQDSKNHYPAIVIDKKLGQDIIGTEILRLLLKEGILIGNPTGQPETYLEEAFEKLYGSCMSWNLTEEQWKKAERFRPQNGEKNWVDFPLAWNTKSYNGKICYVSIIGSTHWLPEKEFNEYLKSAREWIEKE